MYKFPRRFAPFMFGIIQAALTTGIATAIATPLVSGLDWEFARRWCTAWGLAWLTMLPVVICLAPLIRRAVEVLTVPLDCSLAVDDNHRGQLLGELS